MSVNRSCFVVEIISVKRDFLLLAYGFGDGFNIVVDVGATVFAVVEMNINCLDCAFLVNTAEPGNFFNQGVGFLFIYEVGGMKRIDNYLQLAHIKLLIGDIVPVALAPSLLFNSDTISVEQFDIVLESLSVTLIAFGGQSLADFHGGQAMLVIGLAAEQIK